ncbi:uncharacterized protein I303_100038 [Kwoniella dejecticola CBS 10117]|uniref:NmrA-like domain-containing protein n=1 Tax=Kwoniella dejecticola CBS 10117 TaxID=1296121 RepID=A0A1A6ADT2_9TREE|nr:uncharacterized protein I303_00038 [Kwoniella dejecticola CBS 10117]OBR88227.1 hypothetical protein I303_00038 [Kwoniella dejecticola CBS 10117]
MSIVVTGATGKLGKLVVQNLLARVPPTQLAVSVRDSSKASEVTEKGVRVTQASFDDPSSLKEAFKGAVKLLLISVDNFDKALQQHKTAIDVAKEVGVKTIFYTSHIGSKIDSFFAACQHHAETEEYLEKSGLNFYSLRNGFYNENLPMMLGQPVQTGAIYAPEDGPVSWTAHEDLAEAIAILLTDDSKLPQDHYVPLTAHEAVDYDGIAQAISGVTGKTIKKVTIPDEKYVENTVQYGVPEPIAKILLGIYQASRQGDFKRVDPLLENLLGRKPESIIEWAKRVYA